jgi:hypothetical protein
MQISVIGGTGLIGSKLARFRDWTSGRQPFLLGTSRP